MPLTTPFPSSYAYLHSPLTFNLKHLCNFQLPVKENVAPRLAFWTVMTFTENSNQQFLGDNRPLKENIETILCICLFIENSQVSTLLIIQIIYYYYYSNYYISSQMSSINFYSKTIHYTGIPKPVINQIILPTHI